MYIATIPNRSSPPAILLRESYRQGGQVKTRTLANLTAWPPAQLDALRRVLRGDLLVGPDTASTSLGALLHVEAADADALYSAMDWLLRRQPRIEAALAARHLAEGTLVLCDLTSTYFEGHTCPLAQFGHSRDGKKGKVQIVVGLVCNAAGCPVAVEVLPGNRGDPTTLAPQLQKLRAQFHLQRMVLVGDRGLLTDARIRAELQPVPGLDWVTALRRPAIQELVQAGALDLTCLAETDVLECTAPTYPQERL